MAERSGFFNANLVDGAYDRTYLADDFAAYFASFIGNGVFFKSGQESELLVKASSPAAMSVVVSPGEGWINGYWYRNDDDLELDISMADGSLPRIDIIVLRLDFATRSMYCAVVEGTPASSPVAPTPTRTAEVYELQLGEVRVNAGVISIQQAAITDTRSSAELCGIVQSPVKTFDNLSDPPAFVDVVIQVPAVVTPLSIVEDSGNFEVRGGLVAASTDLDTPAKWPANGGSSVYYPAFVKEVDFGATLGQGSGIIEYTGTDDPVIAPPQYDDEFAIRGSTTCAYSSFSSAVTATFVVTFVRRDLGIFKPKYKTKDW